ncbi:hypothetical protein DPMN_148859 [Dreissena polymorpha]|uniref:Uncharacterized protein n=1 Tax=Dreissena polymorpha TaxID=45954 RepID=A0A9D4FAD7_DREPO|nr:hypothetical protein DPMN_148859 [Dreissena polymorpha]
MGVKDITVKEQHDLGSVINLRYKVSNVSQMRIVSCNLWRGDFFADIRDIIAFEPAGQIELVRTVQ